jgi:hypothetical protein
MTTVLDLPSIVSAGVPSGEHGPPGYERLESDVDWDPRFIEITPPERVIMLDELGEGAAGPNAFSPVGITTPFKFLSDEAVQICDEICAELENSAKSSDRIPKYHRGGGYRSRFLWGMSTDPTLLQFFRELAQAPLVPHPVSHHGIHINYAPDDLERNVDLWHADVTSFDYVLMVTDPNAMKGGRFEWYAGPAEEGKALIEAGEPLPAEKVRYAAFPGPGWAVFQQGHRILHRATKLEERGRRMTLVGSYFTPDPVLSDPTATTVQYLRKGDGDLVGLMEGARFKAIEAAHRLLHVAETKTDFTASPQETQQALRDAIAGVEDWIEEFDRDTPEWRLGAAELYKKQLEADGS